MRTKMVTNVAKKVDRALVEQIREESERTREEPYPNDARPARPNRGRSRVYSVGLNQEGYDAVQRVADAARLPPATLVRAWILDRLDDERAAS